MAVYLNITLLMPEASAALREVATAIRALAAAQGAQNVTLAELKTKIDSTAGVIDSATALIKEIAQQLRDSANDPVAIAALADELDLHVGPLADAVAANPTPAPAP